MFGTRQVAAILGVRPSTVAKAVWDGRIEPPAKGPGGAFIWTEADLRRAAWALLGRDLDGLTESPEASSRREGTEASN
jgi:hypothetical protein